MRRHDWTGFGALGAFIIAFVALLRGEPRLAFLWLGAAAALGALTRFWSLKHPAPMPHLLRWTLLVPRGNQTPDHLKGVLEPKSGERILEIGPGVGVHAVPVALALSPDGRLDVLDAQQAMLDDVQRRAAKAGVTNLTAKRGDAQCLPYEDQSFDAAYLVGVLGEIPDGQATLRELRRVLKPNGRLVVGEVAFDPDFVRLSTLNQRMSAAGFSFESKIGNAASYLARFRCA